MDCSGKTASARCQLDDSLYDEKIEKIQGQLLEKHTWRLLVVRRVVVIGHLSRGAVLHVPERGKLLEVSVGSLAGSP
jgi:hypothetical protein